MLLLEYGFKDLLNVKLVADSQCNLKEKLGHVSHFLCDRWIPDSSKLIYKMSLENWSKILVGDCAYLALLSLLIFF